MMKQLIFIVDGLIIVKHKLGLKSSLVKQYDNKLVELFILWNRIYIFSCKESFTDSELNNF